ncbi:MAG: hypothetical protein AB7U43_05240 [Desulfobacter sp.]
MDALFTAFDISSLTTNIQTLLSAGVGIMILFTGYKYLKRGARTV